MSIKIENLSVGISKKNILDNIRLEFKKWKNYLILWKNWSWKSSLLNFLAWNPNFELISWDIKLWGDSILKMEADERSKKWIFLSFQNIPEIEWVRLGEFLRIIYNIHLKVKDKNIKDISPFIFKRHIKKILDDLDISEDLLNRDLNVWFSWGEKRKIEILQMSLVSPSYIFLDEFDSGLDINSFKKTAELLKNIDNDNNSIIIVTHQFNILNYLNFDEVFIMEKWKIVNNWWVELIEKIKEVGFN